MRKFAYRHIRIGIVIALTMPICSASANDSALLASENAKSRKEARERLISAGKNSIPELVDCLDNPSREARLACMAALRAIRLTGGDAISKFGRKARREKDELLRLEAVSVLRTTRFSSISELKRFVEVDSSERVRANALEHVARHGGRQQASFLRERLKDSSKTVRFRAMEGLARWGDCSGREEALGAISGSSQLEEREAAIGVIGACGRTGDIPYLDSLLHSKGERHHLKLSASFAKHHAELMQISEARRLDYLVKALGDLRQGVRLWAAGELIQISGPQVIHALRGVIAIPDHPGRGEAALALDDLKNGN